MSLKPPSQANLRRRRRRRLRIVVSLLAWIGLALAVVPFVESLMITHPPAQTPPLRVRLDTLEPGQALQVKWGGRPVWILRLSPAQRVALRQAGRLPAGDDTQFAVFYAFADGCAVVYQGQRGFLNPCSGAVYDTAGRHVAGSAPGAAHLQRPPYRMLSGSRLEIGPQR